MTSYLETTAKDSCQVDPVSATLKVSGDELKLVESADGLRCDLSDLREALKAASPDITQDTVSVKVAAEAIEPMVDNDEAAALARVIEQNVSDGVKVDVAGTLLTITHADILSWLDFVVTQDGRLDVVVNQERSADFTGQQLSPRVAIAPGVSYITTRDFEEIERKNGPDGRSLNIAATLDQIKYVLVGKLQTATAVVVAVPPRIEYTRTYSATDKGLNALLTNFAKDNKGTFGVSYAELSGERRRAEHNADKRFVTASTYKLYVAYSTLLRVESGKFSWSEHVTAGRSLEACFNDMIIKSDNPCAEALLQKIGFREITDEAKKIGLKNTTFLEGDRPLTSAGDLAVFLATLESGQMLQPASRANLLDAMKRNIFRQGIPAGANGQVADKVGFLDNFLHDAAVVYSPNGTYVLSVMSEDSSWAKIAELTRAIEKLRAS
jgi:beta-lactamase class A